ncbi:hypothetical protein RSAG8_11738, partial [Rhizoctonia solani AG-8 WAC10335]
MAPDLGLLSFHRPPLIANGTNSSFYPRIVAFVSAGPFRLSTPRLVRNALMGGTCSRRDTVFLVTLIRSPIAMIRSISLTRTASPAGSFLSLWRSARIGVKRLCGLRELSSVICVLA